MSEIIRSDMDFDNLSVRTHTKVEQVLKRWGTIHEALSDNETLAFICPYGYFDNTWTIRQVDDLKLESIKHLINDKDTALVKITHFDIPTNDDEEEEQK